MSKHIKQNHENTKIKNPKVITKTKIKIKSDSGHGCKLK